MIKLEDFVASLSYDECAEVVRLLKARTAAHKRVLDERARAIPILCFPFGDEGSHAPKGLIPTASLHGKRRIFENTRVDGTSNIRPGRFGQ